MAEWLKALASETISWLVCVQTPCGSIFLHFLIFAQILTVVFVNKKDVNYMLLRGLT